MVMQARADLRALREMAAKGRDRSRGGGEFLVIWGITIAIGAVLEAVLPLGYASIASWAGSIALGFLVTLIEIYLLRRSPHGATWRTELLMGMWLFAGAAILVFNLGEDMARGGLPSASEATTAMVLAVALAATAYVTHVRLLLGPAAAWIVLGFFLIVAAPGTNVLVPLALAALLLLALPGVLLLYRSSRALDHRPE